MAPAPKDQISAVAQSNLDNMQEDLALKNIELRFFNSLLPWNPNKESILYFRNLLHFITQIISILKGGFTQK